MQQVDIEMNGKRTFQYPEKLNGIFNDVYEKEVALQTRKKMEVLGFVKQPTIESDMLDVNGKPLQIPVQELGWGSCQDLVFDKQTG